MLSLPNDAKDFLKVKAMLDLIDSLAPFSTGYLLMIVFDKTMEGLEEWEYYEPRSWVIFIMKEWFSSFWNPWVC